MEGILEKITDWLKELLIGGIMDNLGNVFDVTQPVISGAGGIISGSTAVSDSMMATLQTTLEGMDLGPLRPPDLSAVF